MLSSNGSETDAGDGSAGDGLDGQAEVSGTVRQCADPLGICDEDPKQMLAFGSEAFGVERLKCKGGGRFFVGTTFGAAPLPPWSGLNKSGTSEVFGSDLSAFSALARMIGRVGDQIGDQYESVRRRRRARKRFVRVYASSPPQRRR